MRIGDRCERCRNDVGVGVAGGWVFCVDGKHS